MCAQPCTCLGRQEGSGGLTLGTLQALDLDAEDKNAIPDAAKAARLLTDIAAVSQEIDLSSLAMCNCNRSEVIVGTQLTSV